MSTSRKTFVVKLYTFLRDSNNEIVFKPSVRNSKTRTPIIGRIAFAATDKIDLALSAKNNKLRLSASETGAITADAVDINGELYVSNELSGTLIKIDTACCQWVCMNEVQARVTEDEENKAIGAFLEKFKQ